MSALTDLHLSTQVLKEKVFVHLVKTLVPHVSMVFQKNVSHVQPARNSSYLGANASQYVLQALQSKI